MKRTCCVLVYNSFLDPLFQNLMLGYMKTLRANSEWTFHLITFEQPEYSMTESECVRLQSELGSLGIVWHPKRHHTGKLLLLKKAYDFISLFGLLLRLRVSGTRVIWSFANVAASLSWVYSKLLRFQTIIYSYEPHSQFMVELGLWSQRSLKYRILNFLETKAGQEADYVLTGTSYMESELLVVKKQGKVFRAPTSVDENDFYFRKQGRLDVQLRHGVNPNEKIILYVGKFGGLYYTYQILLLFKILNQELDPTIRFIVITSNPAEEIKAYCDQIKFDYDKIIYLTKVSSEDIKIYMSAADLGISAVPPTPSQKYRSPTKVAEYLLCGLPFVTCQGVSEDDIVVLQNNVGVVVTDFSEASIRKSMPEITKILNLEKSKIVASCRATGVRYRAKSNVDQLLMRIFNELKLGL